MMTKVLVTGGAGFIGSHVCKALSQAKLDVVVYDNLSRGFRDLVHWGELVVGDLRDTVLLKRILREHDISAVIHLAAFAYVRESLEHPDLYWDNNVTGILSLLNAMQGSNVSNLIFSSSCATYGIPSKIPITLTEEQKPINPYGRTKLVCEWMIRDYCSRQNWKYLILRYFNVGGSDPELEIGECHAPETHIIPIIIQKVLHGENDCVPIYGKDHPTPDGTCVRDFMHVWDLARAHLAALHFLENGGKSGEFNIGNGKGCSLLEIIRSCEVVTGCKIPVRFFPPNPGDPPTLIANPSDTWERLGVTPVFTEIDTMIEHTWKWLRQLMKNN